MSKNRVKNLDKMKYSEGFLDKLSDRWDEVWQKTASPPLIQVDNVLNRKKIESDEFCRSTGLPRFLGCYTGDYDDN